MDDWEKVNKTSLTEKEDFYCNLNMKLMQIVTGADYRHAKRVLKDFEINIFR